MINEPWEETTEQYEDMEEENSPQLDHEPVKSPSLLEVPSYEEERSYWQDN